MTTSVHVVNFGPEVIEAGTQLSAPKKIYPRQSENFYVYDGSDVTIKEVKQEKEQ